MTDLPDGFNSVEHLQQTWRRLHNDRVRRYFKDVDGDGNLGSVRASLKLDCISLDNDNFYVSWMRADLFYEQTGLSKKNLAVIYGDKFATAPPVAGYPQLFLYFAQDGAAQPTDEPLIEHEKSCRLMGFSCASGNAKPAITKADMLAIGNEIKVLFLDAKKGITYTCGNKSASYTDPDNGFSKGNYLLVNSKSDATDIYSKMCNAIDVPFDATKLVLNDPDRASTTTATAGKVTILGKQKNNRRYRPTGILRFKGAYISLGSLVPPVWLIDTTFRHPSLVNWL